jgi:putative SOS response-associated peptidase YedK
MCGRYQRRSDKQRIAEALQLGNVDGLTLELAPGYNAAPQSIQPVIVWDKREGMRGMTGRCYAGFKGESARTR